MIGEFISGGSSLIGSGLNYYGAKRANEMTRDLTREQMGFQERLSNTSYLRAMQDMRNAGLNPILAANLGGATTPQGAQAQMQNEYSGAVSSAMQARAMHAEISKINAETEYARQLAQAVRFENSGRKVESDIDNSAYGRSLRYSNRALDTLEKIPLFSSIVPFFKKSSKKVGF